MKTLDELLLTHKECCTCKVYKPLASFGATKNNKCGLLGSCIECMKESKKRKYHIQKLDPEWKKKEKDRLNKLYAKNIQSDPDYYKKKHADLPCRSTERRRDLAKKRKEKDRLKIWARSYLNHAVRDHRIIKLACEVCGDKKSEAHHEDYLRPLDVTWLCKKHHNELHGKNNYQ